MYTYGHQCPPQLLLCQIPECISLILDPSVSHRQRHPAIFHLFYVRVMARGYILRPDRVRVAEQYLPFDNPVADDAGIGRLPPQVSMDK